MDKEVVQLPSGARVTRNVGSASDSSGGQNSQQGGSSQGGNQQSANTVVIKQFKECRHCGKSLPGINPTNRKNHLLNIRICSFLKSSTTTDLANNGEMEVSRAKAHLGVMQAQQSGVHPGRMGPSAPRAFQVRCKFAVQ